MQSVFAAPGVPKSAVPVITAVESHQAVRPESFADSVASELFWREAPSEEEAYVRVSNKVSLPSLSTKEMEMLSPPLFSPREPT